MNKNMFDPRFDLKSLGWDEFFHKSFEPYSRRSCVPGRVASVQRGLYQVFTNRCELSCKVSGRLRHESARQECLPAAGDWVAVSPRYDEASGTVAGVLPRKSQFVRGAAGDKTQGQIVAANVDNVFVMTALTHDFNPRRIERYLVLAWESGALPVILLNKADLCADRDRKMVEAEALAMGAPVHVTSVVEGTGLQELRAYVRAGKTVALLGSSGVGKSTLINYLAGRELQATQEVRSHDGRGRHTTTSRQLILLPGGGLALDTPGMRELQLWERQDELVGEQESVHQSGIDRMFSDIESLAQQCYFRDCSHNGEPDCAIQTALADGGLDPARVRSYEKLRKELQYQQRRLDKAAEIREKKKWKKLCRLAAERAATKRRG
jgi:ribosome biogenesis GTPase